MATLYRDGYPFVPLQFREYAAEEMRQRAHAFHAEMERRRSVRDFSDRPVSRELIELAICTASTAPSGAHRQPWHFVAVSEPDIKHAIRINAEKEEYDSYEGGRMPPDWQEALAPLGTDWHKPYLETAPWIVVLFEEIHGIDRSGAVRKNYYVRESVGIAAGMFIAAIHHMGLATLPHTPSPMRFLSDLFGRPKNQRPFVLFPIGYPASDALVPDIRRKPLAELAVWNPRPGRDDGHDCRSSH